MPPSSFKSPPRDQSLQNVYDFWQTPKKTRDILAQKPYKINTYADLLKRKRTLLKPQKDAESVDKQTRLKLLKVAEYIKATCEDYQTVSENNLAPFQEEGFCEFVTSSIVVSNTSLDDVYTALGVSSSVVKMLKCNFNIHGCSDLLRKRATLLSSIGEKTETCLNSRTKQLLVKLADYLEQEACHMTRERKTQNTRAVNPVSKFSLSSFEEYLLQTTVEWLHDILPRPDAFSHEWCLTHLTRWVKQLSCPPSTNSLEFIVYGPTQVGKSCAKALLAAVCIQLKIPCVIVTKGVPCAYNLYANLPKRYGVAVCTTKKFTSKEWNKRNAKTVLNALVKGATVVIPNTPEQMEKASKLLKWCTDDLKKYQQRDLQLIKKKRGTCPLLNFVLIADEADNFHRTKAEKSKFEKAYKLLTDLGPRIKVNVTATPVSLFQICDEKNLPNEVLSINPDPKEYIGVQDLQPLQDSTGRPLFLDPDDLKVGSGIMFAGKHIPSTCCKTLIMYKDAVSDPTKTGQLVCDIANRLVYEDDNILEKADDVQLLFADMDRQIIVIICVGEGIFYKVQAGSERRKAMKNKTISDVIEDCDKAFGLDVPIFVFGFITLNRGVSVRSSKRVVTHLQLGLGFGHPLDSVIQAMGRATGNFKSVLEKNLGLNAKITILAYASDYDAATAYVGYCSARFGSKSIPRKLARKYDFSSLTSRRIGQRQGKDAHEYWKTQRQFIEDAYPEQLTVGQEATRSVVFDDVLVQRVLSVLYRMEESNTGHSESKILSFLCSNFYEARVSDVQLHDCLDRLHQLGSFIERVNDKNERDPMWAVKNQRYLQQNLNTALVPICDALKDPTLDKRSPFIRTVSEGDSSSTEEKQTDESIRETQKRTPGEDEIDSTRELKRQRLDSIACNMEID